jgi:hypothetical protein
MSESYNANIVKTIVPKMVEPTQPASASKFILSRRHKRFLPDQSGAEYKESGIKSIRFTINDSTGFWKPSTHYLKFKVQVKGADADKYLDAPGAAAFFQRVSLRTASGARIEERDYYNLYSSIKSHVMDSAECVEFLRHIEGDSMDFKEGLSPYSAEQLSDTGVDVAVGGYGSAANVITASAAVTLKAGDIISVGGNKHYVTADLTAGTSIQVTPNPEDVSNAAGDYDGFGILKVNSVTPRRKSVANQGDETYIELIHKIDLGMLMGDWYLPLPMLKNLQLELTLTKPEFCLVSPNSAADLTYTIKDPELICEIVEFDRSVVEQYKELFNGGGIAYPFMTYRYNNRTLDTNSTSEFQLYANVRSAHSIVNVFTDDSIVTTLNAKPSNSLSKFKKLQMREYEFTSGSERYPFYAPVRCSVADTGIYSVTAYQELRKAMMVDDKKSMEKCGRIKPADLASATSDKFIVGVVLGREDGDHYAGLDLTNENVQYKYTLDDAPPSNHYLHSFLIHSATTNISSEGVIIRS